MAEQEVLRFNVPVGDAAFVTVSESGNKLQEEAASNRFSQTASFDTADVLCKVTFWRIIHHKIHTRACSKHLIGRAENNCQNCFALTLCMDPIIRAVLFFQFISMYCIVLGFFFFVSFDR
jgi:hypothetical protein